MAYIDVPIETQQGDLAEDAFAYLQDKVPGWLPSPGNLEAWLTESQALIASELRTLLALVPDAIFKYYGESVLGLSPFAATQAYGTTSWTMADDAGYTVNAGTLIAITPPASTEGYAFSVDQGFVVPNGMTTIHSIAVTALEAGTAASGITGDVAVLDQLVFVDNVTLDAPTAGGSDAETDAAYLARLSDLLTLLSPRPILPQDFAVMAQRGVPAIARATAIDLYNPDTGESDVPRCVTVVVVGPDGAPCSAQTKSDADALLESQREVNFLVFVVDPTYTTIDVTYAATSYPGYDPVDVQARADANVTAYVTAANWGIPPYGDPSTRSWINDNTVRLYEVAQVINNTDGLRYITALTLGVGGGTQAEADVVMAGVAPLPQPGVIDGTVVAGG